MNLHLAEISRSVDSCAHAVLILDGAGWHGAHDLVVPDNITLLSLPPRDDGMRWRSSAGNGCLQTIRPRRNPSATA